MTEQNNNIDNFFRDALNNYIPPSGKPRMSTSLWVRLLFLSTANKILAAVILAGMIAGGILLFPNLIEETGNIEAEDSLPEKTSQSKIPEKTTFSEHPTAPEAIREEDQYLAADENIFKDRKKTEETPFPTPVLKTTEPQKSMMTVSGKETIPVSLKPVNTIEPRGHHSININKRTVRISPVDSLKLRNRPSTHYKLILAFQPALVYNRIENTLQNGSMEDFSEEYKRVILEPGWNISIRMERRNWMLQTGLTYSTYGEDVTYRQNFYVPDFDNLNLQVDTTWGWVYDPPIIGVKWPLSIDSVWSPTYKQITESYNVKNRYHYLEVPVLLGYQSHIRQISYSVSTGLGVGFLIKQSGYLPGGSDPVLRPSEDFKFNTPQFNYILQAGIGIPVKENIQILVEPFMKYTLNPLVNDPDYDYNHRYLSIGLNLGMIIKIK